MQKCHLRVQRFFSITCPTQSLTPAYPLQPAHPTSQTEAAVCTQSVHLPPVCVCWCLCPRPQPRYLPKCPSESKSRSEPGAMAGRPQAASLQRRCPEETPGAARPLPSAPFTVPAPVPIPIPVPAPAGPRGPPRPCPGPPSPSPGPARRKVAAEGRPPNGRAPTVAARRQPSLGRLHTPPAPPSRETPN